MAGGAGRTASATPYKDHLSRNGSQKEANRAGRGVERRKSGWQSGSRPRTCGREGTAVKVLRKILFGGGKKRGCGVWRLEGGVKLKEHAVEGMA